MQLYLILQFNTLECLIENSKKNKSDKAIDSMSQKVFDYYPPFTHVNLLLPKNPERCNPKDTTEWMKVIITHSTKRRGVRVESVSQPKNGQYHLWIPCTQEELSIINLCLSLIQEHQKDTYCSITTFNALKKYLLFRTSPRFLTRCLLPLPNHKQNGWHCSELITYLLQKARILSPLIYPFFVTPTDLFLITYHKPDRLKRIPLDSPFHLDAVRAWDDHFKTPPREIHSDNSLAIEYFADQHQNDDTTGD